MIEAAGEITRDVLMNIDRQILIIQLTTDDRLDYDIAK
jgi:hypothetical protein